MADYVTLLGAEQVQKAGHAMERAAGEIGTAAGAFQDALMRHQQFMQQWLDDLRALMEKSNG